MRPRYRCCLWAFALLLCALGALPGCSAATKQTLEEEKAEIKQSTHDLLTEEMRSDEEPAHGAGHAQHGNTNPLATDPDLAVYTFVVFGILFLFLAKFAWKPIADGLDKRERAIAEQIDAANRTHEEARNLLALYEKRLAGAHDEVRAMLDEARRDAAHTTQELLAKATAEAEATKARAVRDIETAKVAAVKELAESSGRLAVDLAGRIIGTELDPARHQRLVQDALARFPAGNGNHG